MKTLRTVIITALITLGVSFAASHLPRLAAQQLGIDVSTGVPTRESDVTSNARRVIFVDPVTGAKFSPINEALHSRYLYDLDETKVEIDDDAGCLANVWLHNTGAVKIYFKAWYLDSTAVTVASTAITSQDGGFAFAVGAAQSEQITSGVLGLNGCSPYLKLTVAAVTTEAPGAVGPATGTFSATIWYKD